MEGSLDMLWCAHCRDLIPPTRDNYFTSCSVCGKVLYQSVITTEPALVKNCGTKKRRAGSSVIVKSISSDHSQSSKRTLNKGFMSKSSAEAAQKILKKVMWQNHTPNPKQKSKATIIRDCDANRQSHLTIQHDSDFEMMQEHENVGGAADCKPHVGNQENVYDCSYDGDDEDDHN